LGYFIEYMGGIERFAGSICGVQPGHDSLLDLGARKAVHREREFLDVEFAQGLVAIRQMNGQY
jgi:hypothetical protein